MVSDTAFLPDGFRELLAALYFDGAAMLAPLLTLAAWIFVGLVVMVAVEASRQRIVGSLRCWLARSR